jgi:hypothetical protein
MKGLTCAYVGPSWYVTPANWIPRIRLMLGYCAFGRGQPKRAERDVMRTPWLGIVQLAAGAGQDASPVG